jgi:hypothetical protein
MPQPHLIWEGMGKELFIDKLEAEQGNECMDNTVLKKR